MMEKLFRPGTHTLDLVRAEVRDYARPHLLLTLVGPNKNKVYDSIPLRTLSPAAGDMARYKVRSYGLSRVIKNGKQFKVGRNLIRKPRRVRIVIIIVSHDGIQYNVIKHVERV